MHCVQGKNQANSSDDSRSDHSWVRKLRVEPQDAENQQHKENVRLNNPRKKSLARGKFEGHARSILEHKRHLRAVETRDGSAIQLPKQLRCGIHDQIDYLRIQRLFFGKRPGFSDRLFCQLRVAFAPLRNTSSICCGNPPIAMMGEAAPACVPGAIAAISAESRM